MNRIIKNGWAVQSAEQRIETWGNRLVFRWNCVDDVIVTNAALGSR
jgi:hypothetical protein